MKIKIWFTGVVLLSVLLVSGCQGEELPNLSLEQVILSDLIEENRDILYTDEYREQIDSYLALANDGKASSEEVTAAIESVRKLKDSVLNRKMTFLDKGFESLVRDCLGKGEAGFLTYEDIMDVTSLDLSSRNDVSVSFLDDLSKFPNLTELILTDSEISDFSPIGELTSLRSLDISYACLSKTNQPDLSFLAKLSELESLSLRGVGISDLSFLASLPNLKKLDIGDNPITDYTNILSCQGLTELDISGGELGNLSVLALLPELTSLTCENGEIASLSGIERMTNLTRLDLSGTTLASAELLTGLNGLTDINLSETGLTDGSFLAGKNCTKLNLSGNELSDGTFLATLKNLITADLSDNNLTSLTLNGSSSLMKLNLSGNNLTSLNLNGDYPMLSSLDVSDNRLSSLSVGSASGLTELDAGENQLTSASFLSRLPALKTLILDENPIETIPSGVGAKLVTLSLVGTSLTDTDFLSGMTSLVSLDLWDTLLTDISGLSGLENLQNLRIRLSKVENPDDFTGFPHLKELSVYGMSDSYWDCISQLTELENISIQHSSVSYLCLHDMTSLRTIRVCTCWGLNYTTQVYNNPVLEEIYMEEVDVYLPYISGLPSLKKLSIIEGNVERLTNISDLPACEYMDFSENDTFTDLTFNTFPSLKTVILSECNLSNSLLKKLSVVMNLGYLDLSYNSLTKLTNFKLTGEEVAKLNLTGNRITNFSPLYGLGIAEVIDTGNRGKYTPPEENEKEDET